MPLKSYQKRAVKKYQDAHYEFVKVRLVKGEHEILKQRAEEAGMSMNQYIREKLELE